MSRVEFTYQYLHNEINSLLQSGYTFITCYDYLLHKKNNSLPDKTVVLRVDIDLSIKKAEKLLDIFKQLNIKASFFIRLHAPEYNPFSFENYRIVREMIKAKHEIGYHSEIVDESHIWGENISDCLLRDIAVINAMYGIKIKGIASHGGMTGLNNLDFWNDRKAQDFGLLYEGYDKQPEYNLFYESFYISDSEWTRWKSYNKGIKIDNDTRSPSQHLIDQHPLIHLLIHSDTYYTHNCYENEK